jgi:hypothetical protein
MVKRFMPVWRAGTVSSWRSRGADRP